MKTSITEHYVFPATSVAKNPKLALLHSGIEAIVGLVGERLNSNMPRVVWGVYMTLADFDLEAPGVTISSIRERIKMALEDVLENVPPEPIVNSYASYLPRFWELMRHLDRLDLEPTDEFLSILELVYNLTPTQMVEVPATAEGIKDLKIFELTVALMAIELEKEYLLETAKESRGFGGRDRHDTRSY